MKSTEDIRSLLEREVEILGYELIRLDLFSRGRKKVLRLFIDGPGEGITIDDCVKVTRSLGLVLDDREIMQGPYDLEVSSPGIDRPLVKPAHFSRFIGHDARVEYMDGGSKTTVIGKIEKADEDAVTIMQDGEEKVIRLDSLVKANLHGEKWNIGKNKRRGGSRRRGK